jgi:hypothetical protein
MRAPLRDLLRLAQGFHRRHPLGDLQAIRFEQIVWKTIDVDERWTECSLNLVHRRDIAAERATAAFIACVRQHTSAPRGILPFA